MIPRCVAYIRFPAGLGTAAAAPVAQHHCSPSGLYDRALDTLQAAVAPLA